MSKSISFQKGFEQEQSYPITDDMIIGAKVASLRVGKHHGVPMPIIPGDTRFESLFQEVADAAGDVRHNIWPSEYVDNAWTQLNWEVGQLFDPNMIPYPLQRAGISDALTAAHAVRMDWPSDLGKFIYNWLVSQGVPFAKIDQYDFVEHTPGFEEFLSKNLKAALDKCFEVKWYYGLARPEEYACLPGKLFTAYVEGCPHHPAYPAGHATVSGKTRGVLECWFNFTNHPLEYAQMIWSCFHFATYRTFAGVHYTQDNITGLRHGYTSPLIY